MKKNIILQLLILVNITSYCQNFWETNEKGIKSIIETTEIQSDSKKLNTTTKFFYNKKGKITKYSINDKSINYLYDNNNVTLIHKIKKEVYKEKYLIEYGANANEDSVIVKLMESTLDEEEPVIISRVLDEKDINYGVVSDINLAPKELKCEDCNYLYHTTHIYRKNGKINRSYHYSTWTGRLILKEVDSYQKRKDNKMEKQKFKRISKPYFVLHKLEVVDENGETISSLIRDNSSVGKKIEEDNYEFKFKYTYNTQGDWIRKTDKESNYISKRKIKYH